MERMHPGSLVASAAIALAFSAPISAIADEGLPPGLMTLEFAPVTAAVGARNRTILNEEGEPPQFRAGVKPAVAAIPLLAQSRQQDEGVPPGLSGPA